MLHDRIRIMKKVIEVIAFDEHIGKLGMDFQQGKSFFQYNPEFLDFAKYSKLFPFIIRRTKSVQIFKQYIGYTFQGLPPVIADSLPDNFGNLIFQEWLKSRGIKEITPLEQLTYIANRGMGALEYQPIKELPIPGDAPASSKIDLNEIIETLKKVLKLKEQTSGKSLTHIDLLNVFKIGTSAGGARPKVLISEHKTTGEIIPGDRVIGNDYNHYLVKLHLDDSGYNKEIVEYAYYLLSCEAGIHIMPSKLINNKHFATLRYDRQNGEKQHIRTVSGLTGWDFRLSKDPQNSSYENVFKVALGLKVPYKDIQQLFKRMVFNVIFSNVDDHLKNHSFIYDKENNNWELSPAYDITYPLNPNLKFTKLYRALSINGKRNEITFEDMMHIAEKFTIKHPKRVIEEIENLIPRWIKISEELQIPDKIIEERINHYITPIINFSKNRTRDGQL